ncbi:MAG: 50S ribosomal protein L23 [Pseudomonadota bacterium]|nr:50S ribosomal protein L23 [Pseudomonadota bacterium]MDE3037857.1 50S ribosomal protein L23 [Pseudomonadota bacterium]
MKLGRRKKETAAAVAIRPDHYDVIVSPIVTEKSTMASEYNKVLFNVRLDASKSDIKSAVEAVFGVKVAKVNTHVRQGKTRRFRNTIGRHSDVKKAIITLAEGQQINLEGGVK